MICKERIAVDEKDPDIILDQRWESQSLYLINVLLLMECSGEEDASHSGSLLGKHHEIITNSHRPSAKEEKKSNIILLVCLCTLYPIFLVFHVNPQLLTISDHFHTFQSSGSPLIF